MAFNQCFQFPLSIFYISVRSFQILKRECLLFSSQKTIPKHYIRHAAINQLLKNEINNYYVRMSFFRKLVAYIWVQFLFDSFDLHSRQFCFDEKLAKKQIVAWFLSKFNKLTFNVTSFQFFLQRRNVKTSLLIRTIEAHAFLMQERIISFIIWKSLGNIPQCL